MESFFYKGIWRMDWGLGSPNKTAALIAMLMVAVWGLAFIRFRVQGSAVQRLGRVGRGPAARDEGGSNPSTDSGQAIQPWGFWIALLLFTGLGVCLIHTFSRGGIIAAFAGLAVVAGTWGRLWPWKKIIAVAVSVWVIIGFSIYLEANERFMQGVNKEDKSITNRLEIWRVAPRMMVDAPDGWGLGNAGKAYMQWYQPLDHSEEYRTLVNSHLTWLVEFGWPSRFLYMLAWFAVFALCWTGPGSGFRVQGFTVDRIEACVEIGGRRSVVASGEGEVPTTPSAIPLTMALTEHRPPHDGFSVSLGVWITFAVAALFSSVAESPWLWIVPGVCLLAALGYRIKRRIWPKLVIWLLLPGIAALVMAGLFVLGRGSSDIRGSSDRVIVGPGEPQIWLVADDRVFGKNHGKILREFLKSGSPGQEGFHPEKAWKDTLALVKSVASLGNVSGKTVILSENAAAQEKAKAQTILRTAGKVVLVNPHFFPSDLNFPRENSVRVEAVFGEFSQSPAVDAWAEVATVRRIEGAGDFLPHWPEALLVSHPKK